MKKILLLALITTIPLFSHQLTLEEKVGQLLIVHFNGTSPNHEARELIQELGVGGFIYYSWANGLHSPKEVRNLSQGLQKLALNTRAQLPLFIAVDQEGGVISHLTQGFTQFPGNRALGMAKDPILAEEAAQAMGEELLSVGINMNFAPVIDVNCNPRNPVIGLRSFGEDPKLVAEFGKKALSGYQKASIITTLKHFPGHGDVEVDSHQDLPLINKSLVDLEQMELLPFRTLATNADAIMTAHIVVPCLDKDHCTTLSEKSLSFLRTSLGYRGLIITDSLIMDGVLKQTSTVDEAAIRALQAGADMLLLGGKQLIASQPAFELTLNDIKRIHLSLVNAVKSGRIPESRLDDAVAKILELKKLRLSATLSEDLYKSINTPEHRQLSQKIANLALRAINQKNVDFGPIEEKDIAFFAPQLLQESIHQTALADLGKTRNYCFYSDLNPSDEARREVKKGESGANLIVIFAYDAWKYPSQKKLIDSLLQLEVPAILIVVKDPQDATLFPEAAWVITTFSPSVPSLQAAADYLTKKTKEP